MFPSIWLLFAKTLKENTVDMSKLSNQELCKALRLSPIDPQRGSPSLHLNMPLKKEEKKVTCIHKANIQKLTDGLFLKTCRETATRYPEIKYNEMIIDNCCMQLVMNPSQFDVMVTGNLYGNLIANVGSGLVGGAGVTGGANFGKDFAIFEVGARHLGLDIAGQGKANPMGLIQSAIMMLKHMDLHNHAKKIEQAAKTVISVRKVWTQDLGGSATTKEVTQAIINELANQEDQD